MSLIRHAARTLIATAVIVEGLDAVRDPYRQADGTGKALQFVARHGGPVPEDDPALLVRGHGAIQVGAGLALMTDTATRPAALLLAGTMLPAAVAEDPFWEAEEKAERGQRLRRTLARLGLLGGLLIVAMDTEGRPGVAWKTAWAAKRAGELAEHQKEIIELRAELARERARAATAGTRSRVQATTKQARRDARLASRATRSAGRALSSAGQGAKKAVKAVTPL